MLMNRCSAFQFFLSILVTCSLALACLASLLLLLSALVLINDKLAGTGNRSFSDVSQNYVVYDMLVFGTSHYFFLPVAQP